MQRTTTTLARSLRALTLTIALAGTATTTLAGPHGRGGNHRGYSGHAYEACGQCDRRDYHVHGGGGTLWIGSMRFEVSDRPGALENLARRLRNQGYRVDRHGNEFVISSRHRLGQVQYRNGKFRTVVTDRDRCTVVIRFFQTNRQVSRRPWTGSWRQERYDKPCRTGSAFSWSIGSHRDRSRINIRW